MSLATTAADLLPAICDPANFGDDGLRLAYADLCEEEGEAARAEWVRSGEVRAEWSVGAALVLCGCPSSLGLLGVGKAVVRGGFVSEVELPCADWLRHGPALVRAQPVEVVRLADREPAPFGVSPLARYWAAGGRPGDVRFWRWFEGPRRSRDDSSELPFVLWSEYARLTSHAGHTWEHETEADARHWLSEACLSWARTARPTP